MKKPAKRREPSRRNSMAYALQSAIFASKSVPPRKGRAAKVKRENNRKIFDFSA